MPKTNAPEAMLEEADEAPPDAQRRPVAPLSEGTRAWLGEAYATHHTFVERLLHRSDILPDSSPEVLHDIFATLGERARDGAIPHNTEALLVTIAGFAMCNHGRRRKRRPPMEDESRADDVPASRPDGERRVHIADCERIVAAILATMTPEAGELIRLCDLEELSHAEVAARLGRSVDAVKKAHERARRKFEELVIRYFTTPGFDE